MQEMLPLIIGLIIFIVIGVIGVIFMLKMLNKTKEDAKNSPVPQATASHKNSTQDFLPYDEIMGNLIRIDNSFRCVLKVSSVNYQLMTDFEQDALESSFKTLIDSMDYVFAFYIQTRELDTRIMIERFRADYERLKETMPQCLNYAARFIEEFSAGNFDGVIVKNKYLILTSDDLSHMTALSNEEKAEIAAEQLSQRVAIAQNSLRNIGLNCELLSRNELVELIKLALEKNTQGNIDGIINGEYLTDVVMGEINTRSDTEFNIELLLKEFENRLRVINSSFDVNSKESSKINEISRDITRLRNKYSDYAPVLSKKAYEETFVLPQKNDDLKPSVEHEILAKDTLIEIEEEEYFEL